MRIISRQRDYYDAVMKTGMDREIVYVRETKEVELDKKFGLDYLCSKSCGYSDGTDLGSGGHSVHLCLLGYCGYIFKIYAVKHTPKGCEPIEQFFYNFEEFKEYMLGSGFGSKYDFSTSRWWPGTYQKFEEQDTKALRELFHQYNTPLFLINSKNRDGKKQKLTLGPILKDLEFQRQKDPYTAYQDIFQYVAGHLNRPENTMVKISDLDKIHKHGFDKWSFRKMPTKKK
jgi:hypothetical protein